MTNIQVKNVEPTMHDQLRERAAAANTTLSDYVLELIRRDLRKPLRRDWLDLVSELPRHDITSHDVVAGIARERPERIPGQ